MQDYWLYWAVSGLILKCSHYKVKFHILKESRMNRLAIVETVHRSEETGREIPGAQALRRGVSLLDIVADMPGLRFSEIADRSG